VLRLREALGRRRVLGLRLDPLEEDLDVAQLLEVEVPLPLEALDVELEDAHELRVRAALGLGRSAVCAVRRGDDAVLRLDGPRRGLAAPARGRVLRLRLARGVRLRDLLLGGLGLRDARRRCLLDRRRGLCDGLGLPGGLPPLHRVVLAAWSGEVCQSGGREGGEDGVREPW
jgi:hypothetical protein